jgi:hypothetical protein
VKLLAIYSRVGTLEHVIGYAVPTSIALLEVGSGDFPAHGTVITFMAGFTKKDSRDLVVVARELERLMTPQTGHLEPIEQLIDKVVK